MVTLPVQRHCAGREHSRSHSFISGIFWDSGCKSQWCADGCLAEFPKRPVVLLLLLANLVKKPTWHAAATCLGPSQQRGIIKLQQCNPCSAVSTNEGCLVSPCLLLLKFFFQVVIIWCWFVIYWYIIIMMYGNGNSLIINFQYRSNFE